MSLITILTLVTLCGIVWGGFAYLIQRAIRSEAAKRQGQSDS